MCAGKPTEKGFIGVTMQVLHPSAKGLSCYALMHAPRLHRSAGWLSDGPSQLCEGAKNQDCYLTTIGVAGTWFLKMDCMSAGCRVG